MLRRLLSLLVFALLVGSLSAAANRHLFVCRSPLLAYDFYGKLENISQKGVKITEDIARQVCEAMKADKEPQCIRVEAEEFKPIASGWGGAIAVTDGKTKVYFHNPDAQGWVHPQYFVANVNEVSK